MKKEDIDSIENNSRISHAEKDELMDFKAQKEGLGFFDLFIAIFILILILGIFTPKIYLSNNIYYISRDITRLYSEKELLNEERIRLEKEIEYINQKHLRLELGV